MFVKYGIHLISVVKYGIHLVSVVKYGIHLISGIKYRLNISISDMIYILKMFSDFIKG